MGAYQLPKNQVEQRIQEITDLFPRLGEDPTTLDFFQVVNGKCLLWEEL